MKKLVVLSNDPQMELREEDFTSVLETDKRSVTNEELMELSNLRAAENSYCEEDAPQPQDAPSYPN